MTQWDMRIPDRRSLFAVAAACVATLLFFCGCSRKENASKAANGGLTHVRLQMDWTPETEYGGYYEAQALGFYRDAGLQVDLVPGGPSVPTSDIVALGRAEFGMTDGNMVLVAISRGLPLVIVGVELQHNPQGLMFHKEHPLSNFEDLQGKTIMAGAGSAWVDYLRRSRHVNFDLLPLTEDLTSFLNDDHFIQQCFVTQEPYSAEQKGAHVGTLLIADSGYDPYRVIFTSRDYLEKHRDVVRAFVAASVRGFVDFIDRDPKPGLDAVEKANPMMKPDVMAYSLAAMKHLHLVEGNAAAGERPGVLKRERIASQIKILGDLGLLGRKLTADEVADFKIFPLESR